MILIHGHFDGKAVVLDEAPPPAWVEGQRVRVVVDAPVGDDANAYNNSTASKCELGAWQGKLHILEDGEDVILDHFKEYLP